MPRYVWVWAIIGNDVIMAMTVFCQGWFWFTDHEVSVNNQTYTSCWTLMWLCVICPPAASPRYLHVSLWSKTCSIQIKHWNHDHHLRIVRWIKEWICSERPITITAIVNASGLESGLRLSSLGDRLMFTLQRNLRTNMSRTQLLGSSMQPVYSD